MCARDSAGSGGGRDARQYGVCRGPSRKVTHVCHHQRARPFGARQRRVALTNKYCDFLNEIMLREPTKVENHDR